MPTHSSTLSDSISSVSTPRSITSKRDYMGRFYVFSEKKSREQTQEVKKLLGQHGVDVDDIKIDYKPYLREVLIELTHSGDIGCPQVFFNDQHIGGLDALRQLENENKLSTMIDETKRTEDTSSLQAIYKKQADIFELSPDVLHFPPPYNRGITCVVQLVNKTDLHAAFKIKTTAPKRYLVKPRQGFLDPNGSERIEVVLQKHVDQMPSEGEDKFRVEGILLSSFSPNARAEDIFAKFEKSDTKDSKKSIVRQKMECVFRNPPSNFKVVQYNDGIVIEQLPRSASTTATTQQQPASVHKRQPSAGDAAVATASPDTAAAASVAVPQETRTTAQQQPQQVAVHAVENAAEKAERIIPSAATVPHGDVAVQPPSTATIKTTPPQPAVVATTDQPPRVEKATETPQKKASLETQQESAAAAPSPRTDKETTKQQQPSSLPSQATPVMVATTQGKPLVSDKQQQVSPSSPAVPAATTASSTPKPAAPTAPISSSSEKAAATVVDKKTAEEKKEAEAEEESRLRTLTTETLKAVAELDAAKLATVQLVDKIDREEYNKLQKQYDQLLSQIELLTKKNSDYKKQAEQYDRELDQERTKASALESELKQAKIRLATSAASSTSTTPSSASTPAATPFSPDATPFNPMEQGYSIVFVVFIAVMFFLIGKIF